MAALFQRADLAVSRAGAGTLIELAMTGTPAILIPYPFAAEDHQTYNAAAFSQTGAAQVYQQARPLSRAASGDGFGFAKNTRPTRQNGGGSERSGDRR